ncbi:MAG: PilZ domain-containing protein [Acidobacteriota bacterium]|nr:PilZ domain-containing protein [Acidobacteriota bacterium]
MSATSTPKSDTNDNRRISRVPISLPVKVAGKDDQNASWNEITRLEDVSAFGAGFRLSRPFKRGRLLHLTLPMPRQMRCYDHMEGQYQVWAIVRRCRLVEDSRNSVTYEFGVAFVGKHPPSSYFDNPTHLYDLEPVKGQGLWNIVNAPSRPDDSHLPKEDRTHSRYQIPVNLSVEVLDENGEPQNIESTVTENISLSGAAVFTTLDVEVGSMVKITSEQDNLSIKAIVRGKRVGPDGITRIHIEFVDSYFPLRGIDL